MRLSEAADVTGVTKQKLWRAVKAGKLEATRKQRGGKKAEFSVTAEALERYRSEFLDSVEMPAVTDVTGETSRYDTTVTDETERSVTSVTGVTGETFPVQAILDRLEQAQRQAITLELQLQQTQRLLCENNDSQHEREARALEAEAKAEQAVQDAETAKQEAAQAKIELESLKTELSTKEQAWSEARRPWWKKMFRAG